MNITSTLNSNINGEYCYIRNAQGDIIGLIDKNGTQVVSYLYDSWGKLLSITGTLKDTVGVKNPYRYREYRYDTETGLYYLQSRYYNAEWGRFINADSQLNPDFGLLGMNMYAYCGNNPVNAIDSDGRAFMFLTAAIGAAIGGVATNVFYQVTSKDIANNVMKTGEIVGSKQEAGHVFAWTQQPTLNQATQSGARFLETVIKFETKASFMVDTTVDKTLQSIARVSSRPEPIKIFNAVEVGFKKGWFKR